MICACEMYGMNVHSSDHQRDDDRVVSVMVPVAVNKRYSYLSGEVENLALGDVVEVPLKSRKVLGVVCGFCLRDDVLHKHLKLVVRRVGNVGLPNDLLVFIDWVAAYNVFAPGLLLRTVLRTPEALNAPSLVESVVYRGGDLPRMTSSRRRVISTIQDGVSRTRRGLAQASGVTAVVVDKLIACGLLGIEAVPPSSPFATPDADHAIPDLNIDQQSAVDYLRSRMLSDCFSVTLIEGVTGSGKTEVYFEAVSDILKLGCQVLILLPEIALTGQFLRRFEHRFGVVPAEWHSGLTARRRMLIWRAVRCGQARVVIGVRSALYLPFSDLGLIIVDEEHDAAYKQDDMIVYHARDMSVKRGHLGNFPVLLSSATPSLETRVNANSGKYGKVSLPTRFGSRAMPLVRAVDLRTAPAMKGSFLSPELIAAMHDSFDRGGQVLLFLNRRGYAPLTLCGACGWRFTCHNCSAWLVEHRYGSKLTCHYCGFTIQIPETCPSCNEGDRFVSCGPGVERIAQEASLLFPDKRQTILSSDFTRDSIAVRAHFQDIADGHYTLIIGTQLISKGHNFPKLSLVGVVDGDLGLGHGDLRASERTFQLLHQVVGRAGRGAFSGHGLIQTHMPEHPVMQALISGDSDSFYEAEIKMRERACLPPFGRLSALIISASDREKARSAACKIVRVAPSVDGVRILGPAEAPLSLLRGRYRFRILIKGEHRIDMQSYVSHLLSVVGSLKGGVHLRTDMDPQNFL